MRFGLFHPREQLAQIMSRIYRYGLTTMSGGNLSIRTLYHGPLVPIGEDEIRDLEAKFG